MNETSGFIPLIPQYIKYAIPLFSVTIVIEFLFARRQNKQDHYRVNDTINNLTMGIFSQITDILAGLIKIIKSSNSKTPGTFGLYAM